jgi:hypothetical protein
MKKEQAVTAAYADGISTLPITASGVAVFGVWGGDPRGGLLKLVVYRGGTAAGQAYSGGAAVNEGPKPAVQVKVLLEVAGSWTRVYQAIGLRPGDAIYGTTAAGLHYIGPLEVTQVSGTASGVMRNWANRLRDDPAYRPTDQFLCPLATPYLALTKPGQTPVALSDALVGGPMSAVHGLSVHTTGGGGTRDAFATAIYGCVGTWNHNYEASGFIASTHFCISSDGVIVRWCRPTALPGRKARPATTAGSASRWTTTARPRSRPCNSTPCGACSAGCAPPTRCRAASRWARCSTKRAGRRGRRRRTS